MTAIKIFFPGEFYTRRKVKVQSESETFYLNKSNEKTAFLIDKKVEKLKFKIDYHQSELDLVSPNQNIIVYFDFSPNPVLATLQLMFKNCLRTKQVSEEEFVNLNPQNFYHKEESNLSRFSFTVGIILSLFLFLSAMVVILSLPKYNVLKDFNAVLFYFGLISSVGVISLFKKDLKVDLKKLKTRTLTGSIASIALLLIYNPSTQLFNSLVGGLAFVLIGIILFNWK